MHVCRRFERSYCLATAAIALASPACQPNPPKYETVSSAWERRPAAAGARAGRKDAAQRNAGDAAAADSAGDVGRGAATDADAPVAAVNGRPIDRDWLVSTLVESHGLPLLMQRLSLEMVRAEADKAGVTATDADVDAEIDRTLNLTGSGASAGTEARPTTGGDAPTTQNQADRAARGSQRQRVIEQWRAARGVSEQELRLAMERQALLRKLAESRLTVSEERLRAEFERLYAGKVECRHIVLGSLREADRVRGELTAGANFADLAGAVSLNTLTGRVGGMLPPFARADDSIPALLRETAFSLSPGDVSNPIKIENTYHLLKLERIIPAESVRYEDVRESVAASLRGRSVQQEMEKLYADIQQGAAVTIRDPELRRQYLEGRAAGRLAGPPLRGE